MAPIVVGTHALISGVAWRSPTSRSRSSTSSTGSASSSASALEAKAGGRVPHLLLMTATPIPRTLGQVLYADLDVTDLRTPPEGRVRIRTGIREPDALDVDLAEGARRGGARAPDVRRRAADHARRSRGRGRRAPTSRSTSMATVARRASASPASSAVAAEPEAERLRELLAPLRVGLVHGRLKAADRDAEMARFRDGELDVLVGTTVVEVGVDVPEATMMIIQGADRFGLAQLHQLRGRVGRGTVESFCVLVSETTDRRRGHGWRRLATCATGSSSPSGTGSCGARATSSGLVQSGLPRLRIASLQREGHRELATAARAAAEALLDDAGALRPGHEALARELSDGWLARVAQAEPAGAA